jgi:hypothetical protein
VFDALAACRRVDVARHELVLRVEDNRGARQEVLRLHVLGDDGVDVGELRDEQVEHEYCADREEGEPEGGHRLALLLKDEEVVELEV